VSRPAALQRVQIAGLGDSVGELAEQARAAEAAGIDGVWAVELFRSSLTQAMWLAANTERVSVGTGIAWAFTRSPMIIALSALDIDEASGGRFRLGLGAGVKRLNETWHGVEYGRPAPHLRETVEAVRLIIERAGSPEPIRYQGTYHEIDIKGWVRPHPKVRETIPIYTAAVQEGMARAAGDVADGMIGHPMCSMRWLDEVLVANFELGLSRSGRERGDFDFLPTVCCAIDDDEEAAIDAARRTICFYATVRTYAPLWELHGFGDAAAAVGEAFRRGDFAAMPTHVPDEMVDTYTAAGPLDKVRERVEAVAERGDGIWFTPPTYFLAPEQIAEYQRRIVEAFAPGERRPA
jgi:probable F420-dependent oxidoreductase